MLSVDGMAARLPATVMAPLLLWLLMLLPPATVASASV
jgi:hypothetical protein